MDPTIKDFLIAGFKRGTEFKERPLDILISDLMLRQICWRLCRSFGDSRRKKEGRPSFSSDAKLVAADTVYRINVYVEQVPVPGSSVFIVTNHQHFRSVVHHEASVGLHNVKRSGKQ